jgi:uncharacterized membrane protein YukC
MKKELNAQYINEKSMRFEALQQLREIQANLVSVSFLPVIAVMREENPLKKSVLAFQDTLDDLTMEVQKFISDAKNGVDYAEAEDEEIEAEDKESENKIDDEEIDDEEIDDEEEEKEEKKDKQKKKEVEDSSEPKD